ncbi:MAG: hypothetical protein HC837_11780 [Chloroflexaceae bacterium]|nr:hypothetical protein [Chloroflexaceae bacterium]
MLHLTDDLYQAVQKAANASESTPDQWILSNLQQQLLTSDSEHLRQMTDPAIYELLQEVAPEMGMSTDALLVDWYAKYGTHPHS